MYYSSCFALVLIKMHYFFHQRVGRRCGGLALYSVHHLFLAHNVSGCQMAKPAGSLFECQNGGRGKGSRKPVIKIPTTLLTASPQPAFISLPGLGRRGTERQLGLRQERRANQHVQENSSKSWAVSNSRTRLVSDREFVVQIMENLPVREAGSAPANATVHVKDQNEA